jgi:phosphate-selective porin OprO and OprP
MKSRTRNAPVRLAVVLAGLGFLAFPCAAVAQQPAQAAPADDIETRLRKLEELNEKLEKQNQKLAEQNEKLEKQNQRLLDTAPAAVDAAPTDAAPPAVPPDDVKKLVDGYLKEKDDKKKADDAAKKAQEEAEGYEVGSDLNMKAFWRDGFTAETANKDFRVHVGGRLQADFGWFDPDNGLRNAFPGGWNDGADIRRARLRVDGTAWEVIDWVLEYEFAASTNVVLTPTGPSTVLAQPTGGGTGSGGNGAFSSLSPTDVYFDIKELPYVGRFRAGHFKEPYSLEDYGNPDSFLTFLERSTPSDAFSPNRNLGVMLWNDPFDQRLVYAVGVFKPNSNNSFSNAFDYANGAYAYTGRIGVNPWYENDGRCVLFFGGGYSYRSYDNGVATDRFRAASRIPIRVGSPTIVDTTALTADDAQLFNAEALLIYGPFSLQTEYYNAQVNNAARGALAPGVPRLTNPDLDGFYVDVSYFLTGESRTYLRDIGGLGRIRPLEPFYFVPRGGLGSGLGNCFGKGAWQIAARYEYLNLNSADFGPFPAARGVPGSAVAPIATAGWERDILLGLNWYLNSGFRIQWNYTHALRNVANPFVSGAVDAFAMRFAFDF